jgi:NTE family protein
MRAGVFAGGGSFGAYTVGVLAKTQPIYDVTYGCSTGSLIAPFAVLGEWELLKDNYTNVTAKNIFKVNPFLKSGFPNIFVIIKRLIFNKTLGDTTNLRELIKKNFTIEHYNKILELKKDVCIVVTSVTDKFQPCKYIYLSKTSYEDFCFYMWASTCVPMVTSIAIKDNCEYVDGGVTDVIPLFKAIDDGFESIDVYSYDEPGESNFRTETKNPFHLAARCYNIMREVISNAGFVNAYLEMKNNTGIKIHRIHPPYKLAANALVFDKKQMLEWYNLGYNS